MRRKALRLYALCQSHIVALAAAAQPAKHNIVVLCNRGQYINDRSPQTVERLLIYCILCVRATLCIVFLSPLLKIGTFAPVFSVMLLMLNGSDMEAVARSPLSLLCFGQCTLLVRDITDGFIIKVIVSAVVSCAIYYLIGYFTLQKKIDLEPHKFT